MPTLTKETFVPPKLLDNLNRLTKEKADQMPIGIVKLDDEGNVQLYNKYNSIHFAEFSSEQVEGMNYFEEVAPCTNNFMFSGRFKKGVEQGDLDHVMDYNFTYRIKPTQVRVHLYRDQQSGTNWIFLKVKD